MWNHKKYDEKVFAQPTKQNQLSSAFLFVNVLFALIFIFVLGYLIYERSILIDKIEQDYKLGLQLSRVIISTSDIFKKINMLINQNELNYDKYKPFLLAYEKQKQEYLLIRKAYSSIKSLGDSVNNEIQSNVDKYFNSIEKDVLEIQYLLDRTKLEMNKLASADLSKIIVKYKSTPNISEKIVTENYEHTLNKMHVYNLQIKKNQNVLFICCFGLFCYSIIILYLFVRGKRRMFLELRKFYALLERSANPMQVTDRRGIIKYVNPAFVNWIGVDKEKILGENVFVCMKNSSGGNDAHQLWETASNLLSAGKAWIGEVEIAHSSGHQIFSNVIISPVLNEDGSVTECIVMHNDQTELKKYARKIIETQKHYESIVESSLDAIVISQRGSIVYVNPSAVRLFGYASAEDMLKLDLTDIISVQNKSFFQTDQESYMIGEEILCNYEMRGLTRLGKMIDLEMNAHMIEWNNQSAIQTSFRDITERKMLEREQSLWLWEQETLSDIDRKLVGVMELEKIFSAILQQTLNLTRANFSGVLLYGKNHEQVKWESISGNIYQHTLEPFYPNNTLKNILSKREPLIINDNMDNLQYPLTEVSVLSKEKLISTVWLPLIIEGKHKGVLVVGYRHKHDFTGREMRLLVSIAEKHTIAMVNAQLYANLLEREKELEILSDAQVKAQEDERRRIAREIHDGLGQMLTAVKFNLEILEDAIDIGKEEQGRMQDIKKLLDDIMKEAREISYNLMPSVLDDFGLVPALQLLSEQFSNRTNIKVNYTTHNISGRLDPEIEISLYRIVQEGLNNVAKHSEATEVNLQVIRHNQGIKLIIEDNGKGMPILMNKIQPSFEGGMGIVSMRERANALGGTLIIDSMPKNGTLIIVEIPISELNTNGKDSNTNSR